MGNENLTVVVPFWNGHSTIGRLLDTLPAGLPVVIVDDHSDQALRLGDLPDRPGVRIVRPQAKGWFAGAVNAGLETTDTDVLVLNQDVWFRNDEWLPRLLALRADYGLIGDGVLKHPAWPKGYVQGTFMFMRRDAISDVGGLDVAEYPLWGGTCEWQLRACRKGYRVHVSHDWRRWMGHEGRHGDSGHRAQAGRRPRYGGAITEAMSRWPERQREFIRTPPAVSVIMPCFNYGRYLQDAVNSLIGGPTSLGEWEPQTLQSFEVIIVDDASTDGGRSWDQARELADPWKGIHAIRLPENRGTPGAINAGCARAYGEYLHVLSADDMREPWGLQVLYEGVRANPHSAAYGDVRIFKRGERGRVLKLPNYDFDLVLHKNPMPAGIMYPRAAWREVGGYPEAMIYGREDWAFNIKLGIHGYCGIHVGMSGNLYRREGQNRSLRTGNVHRGEKANGGFDWRSKFKEQLRSLYPKIYAGERPMGCCGGRRSTLPRADSQTGRAMLAASRAVIGAAEDKVLIEYIGGNSGNSSWWGPVTGTRYIAGGGKRVVAVDPKDADAMIALRKGRKLLFRRYRMQPAAKVVEIPKEQAVVANPPEPDDLTEIKGVGPATAEKLASSGFPTFLELARTRAEQVADVAGITLRTARAAVEGAKAFV